MAKEKPLVQTTGRRKTAVARVRIYDGTGEYSINGRTMDTYHRWMEVVIGASLAGLPVINVPAGFDKQNRPMGMQIIGPYGEDKRVLEFALAYEAISDHLDKKTALIEQP